MKKTLIVLFCLFMLHLSQGQQHTTDMSSIASHIQNEQAKSDIAAPKVHIRMTYNPVKLLLFIPLYLYQKFVSEQVSAVCEFEPSCSNFGVQSIAKLGFVKGLFLTADRLTRCNGNAQTESKYYLIDHHSGKVIDEPGMYKFRD